ncbi:MAG: ISKra4 family transposase [Deltaproteobacteria bacterium]|nr:ISKra4 family transposase [Deltaproteobacteria bacterium]
MAHVIKGTVAAQKKHSSDIEQCLDSCKEKFNQILFGVINAGNQDAHKMEASIFKQLMKLGFILMQLFFASQNKGNYGKTIEIAKGIAKRGRTSVRSYFSIFGKMKVTRYLYHIEDVSFAPLDILLNLPVRCYSYFLSEFANLLNINAAYENASGLLKKFFGVKLSISALETISSESSDGYEDYYDLKNRLPKLESEEDYVVVSFDGKGVPMIKAEAAKIVARQGKGEKKQKKKEALVGVKYEVNANIRTAEEVATNLVYPEKKEDNNKTGKPAKAQNIRYIASVEKPKRKVMEEIHEEVKDENFSDRPLVCVMDGALHLWNLFKDVFKNINNKVFVLDIIHILEYIWIIAHIKYKEGSDDGKKYVYKKLLLILQGKVASYIMELQREMLSGGREKTQCDKFLKVITYLKNHKEYMKYDHYLSEGYPIGSGVVESACSHVVKDRMEISGARWGINGSDSILKLRSVAKSKDWDEYWEFFTAQAKNNISFSNEYNLMNVQEKMVA